MGEERGCKEFRKHVSWYLKGFAAGGELRRALALVDLARRARRAARPARPGRAVPGRRAGHAAGPPGVAARQGRAARGLARRHRRHRLRATEDAPRPPAGEIPATRSTPRHRIQLRITSGVIGPPGPRSGIGRPGRCALVVNRVGPWPRAGRRSTVPPTAKDQRCGRPSPQAGHQCPPQAQGPAVVGPLAVLATASAVTSACWPPSPAPRDLAPLAPPATRPPRPSAATRRSPAPSDRVRPRRRCRPARPSVHVEGRDHRRRSKARRPSCWTTDDLNIWTEPGDKAEKLGELEAGKKVLVTGREMWGRTEIVLDGESRWVTAGYLSDEKPPDARLATAPTAPRSPAGVSANIEGRPRRGLRQLPRDHRLRHAPRRRRRARQGRAVDIMVSGERAGRSPTSSARTTPRSASATSSTPRHLVRGARRRGLARHGRPRVGDRQPLRPRARLESTEVRRSLQDGRTSRDDVRSRRVGQALSQCARSRVTSGASSTSASCDVHRVVRREVGSAGPRREARSGVGLVELDCAAEVRSVEAPIEARPARWSWRPRTRPRSAAATCVAVQRRRVHREHRGLGNGQPTAAAASRAKSHSTAAERRQGRSRTTAPGVDRARSRTARSARGLRDATRPKQLAPRWSVQGSGAARRGQGRRATRPPLQRVP